MSSESLKHSFSHTRPHLFGTKHRKFFPMNHYFNLITFSKEAQNENTVISESIHYLSCSELFRLVVCAKVVNNSS